MSACLTSADHITPQLIISCSDERSYGLAAFAVGLFERAQHRLGERVADDRHLRDALALGTTLPQLVGVEVAALERDDATAGPHRLERRERAGAVHQRRRGQVRGVARLDELLRERADVFRACRRRSRRRACRSPSASTPHRSSKRHITPLGMPVVPPV